MNRKIVIIMVLALLVLLTFSAAAQAKGRSWTYKATLTELNGSGVAGVVEIKLVHGQLVVNVKATGLTPRRVHAQAIRGFADGSPAGCPGPAADVNGDGWITLAEGTPFFGKALLPLNPAPKASRKGSINFQRVYRGASLKALDLDATPLTTRVVVLQGMDVSGQYTLEKYDPTIPVACGKIVRR